MCKSDIRNISPESLFILIVKSVSFCCNYREREIQLELYSYLEMEHSSNSNALVNSSQATTITNIATKHLKEYHFYYYSKEYSLVPKIIVVLAALLAVSAVILNSSLIAAFLATKQTTKNTSNIIISSISISDLLSGIIGMPLFAYFSIVSRFNVIAAVTAIAFYLTSEVFTVLLAVDRYIHMNPNLNRESKIQRILSKPYIFFVLIICVAYSSGAALLTFYWPSPEYVSHFALGGNISNVVAMSLVAGLYLRGYYRIRHFTEDNPVYRNEDGTTNQPQYVRKLFKTVLLLTVAMFCTYSPVTIGNIAYFVYFAQKKPVPETVSKFVTFAFVLAFANSSINSLIVLNHNDIAREWVKKNLFGKCLRRRDRGSIQCVR